jgi:hypothetical protein
MSDMQHTPGPWAVHPVLARVDAFDAIDPSGLDGDGLPICQMLWPTELRSEDETDANARLIAAAPELLEALKAARTALNSVHETDGLLDHEEAAIAIIDAALAKAGA